MSIPFTPLRLSENEDSPLAVSERNLTSEAWVVLVHYGELTLKGKNRNFFIQRLEVNLRQALEECGLKQIKRLPGRLLLEFSLQAEPQLVYERLRLVIGIANFAPAVVVPLDLASLKKGAVALLRDLPMATFRISARRAFKNLPFSSTFINEQIGAEILKIRPELRVQLKGADINLHIEMLPDSAYLYLTLYPGLPGLPVGVSGKVLTLLSGGIDSPVAAFRMQKRGAEVTFVHFHSYPFQSRQSIEKVKALAQNLARFQGKVTLFLVPFGELQREISVLAKQSLRIILYRRFMLRLANMLAQKNGLAYLVVGDSLGQVASQTLANMAVIEEASSLPLFRPLLGFSKAEIIAEAEQLGTFPISIIPDQDCCQLFMPEFPEIQGKLSAVQAAERHGNLEELSKKIILQVERLELRAKWESEVRP